MECVNRKAVLNCLPYQSSLDCASYFELTNIYEFKKHPFSEEEESEEAAKVREERLAAYAAKKAKKPALIAKTSVLLDCKPWDDETNMDDMLKEIKKIEMDGLVWGANKLVPVGYGISKLQVMIVVEDLKVSIEELQEKICEIEDYVQSCDVAAMNKI